MSPPGQTSYGTLTDGIKPFGFFVHGAVDGFSRRILWLEVNFTNKNPRVIASNYLNVVQQLGGVPRRMRCDRGTENTIISTLQQFFRWYDDDHFAGSVSFIEGKSIGNQRIQAWWSKFREGGGGWWINLLKTSVIVVCTMMITSPRNV